MIWFVSLMRRICSLWLSRLNGLVDLQLPFHQKCSSKASNELGLRKVINPIVREGFWGQGVEGPTQWDQHETTHRRSIGTQAYFEKIYQ